MPRVRGSHPLRFCVYLEACTGADTRNDAAFYRLANAYYRRSDSRAIHLSTCAHVTGDNGCLDANVDGARMHCYGRERGLHGAVCRFEIKI